MAREHSAIEISVVIPARNDAEFLREALAALRRQSRPADEIVVVDNDSDDDTADVARAAGATVIAEARHGIWPAAARGYDEARGTIIARLDADSVPPPDWLERIEAAFAASPGLAAVTGHAGFYGSRPWANWVGENVYLNGMYIALTPVLGHPPVFGSNFAMRAEVWHELRERVHSDRVDIHDDMDLSLQFTPELRVRYDRSLRVEVSARPFDSWSSLWRRVAWVGTTYAANWPQGAPWRMITAEHRYRRALRRRRRGRRG